MARTYKNLPPEWEGEESEFTEKWRRGKLGTEIDAAEGRFDIAWGKRAKRSAKKKKRRQRRRSVEKIISEQLEDLGL